MVDLELETMVTADGPLEKTQLNEILRRRSVLQGAAEPGRLEYKEGFDGETRSWAELLKDIVAFHNGPGGIIVFGVSDSGDLVGLHASLSGLLDSAKISDQLKRKTTAAGLDYDYREWACNRKLYGALRIRPGKSIVIFDKDGGYAKPDGSQEMAFRSGVVYTRTSGKCAPATQSGLERMVRNVVSEALSEQIAKINVVANLPPEVGAEDLVARDPDSPERGWVLQRTDYGTPVQIVDGDVETEAVPLGEVFDTDLPYPSLQTEINAAVRFWKGHPNTRTSARTLYDWFLRRDEVSFDQDAAECCMLSAIDGRAINPLYWASLLDFERLRRVIEREMEEDSWPFTAFAPYLIAVFFWSNRESFLDEVGDNIKNYGIAAAERARQWDRTDFLTRGRSNTRRTFPDPRPGASEEEKISTDDVLKSRSLTEEMLEAVVRRDREQADAPQWVRTLGYQCDIALAAPDGPEPGT